MNLHKFEALQHRFLYFYGSSRFFRTPFLIFVSFVFLSEAGG